MVLNYILVGSPCPISKKESDRRVLLQNQVVGLRNSLVTFCHQSPSKFFTPSSGFYPNCFKPRSNRNQKLMSKAMGGITEVKPGRKSDKWQACQNMNMCEKLQLTNQTKQWWKGELHEDYSFIQLNLLNLQCLEGVFLRTWELVFPV